MDARLAQTVRRFLLRAPDGLTDEELLELLLDYASDEGEAQTVAAALIEPIGLGFRSAGHPGGGSGRHSRHG